MEVPLEDFGVNDCQDILDLWSAEFPSTVETLDSFELDDWSHSFDFDISSALETDVSQLSPSTAKDHEIEPGTSVYLSNSNSSVTHESIEADNAQVCFSAHSSTSLLHIDKIDSELKSPEDVTGLASQIGQSNACLEWRQTWVEEANTFPVNNSLFTTCNSVIADNSKAESWVTDDVLHYKNNDTAVFGYQRAILAKDAFIKNDDYNNTQNKNDTCIYELSHSSLQSQGKKIKSKDFCNSILVSPKNNVQLQRFQDCDTKNSCRENKEGDKMNSFERTKQLSSNSCMARLIELAFMASKACNNNNSAEVSLSKDAEILGAKVEVASGGCKMPNCIGLSVPYLRANSAQSERHKSQISEGKSLISESSLTHSAMPLEPRPNLIDNQKKKPPREISDSSVSFATNSECDMKKTRAKRKTSPEKFQNAEGTRSYYYSCCKATHSFKVTSRQLGNVMVRDLLANCKNRVKKDEVEKHNEYRHNFIMVTHNKEKRIKLQGN